MTAKPGTDQHPPSHARDTAHRKDCGCRWHGESQEEGVLCNSVYVTFWDGEVWPREWDVRPMGKVCGAIHPCVFSCWKVGLNLKISTNINRSCLRQRGHQWEREPIGKGVGGWMWWNYYVLKCKNGKMWPVETIPRRQGGGIKENNGGGEFN
jgi:hypothetical protein